MANKTIILSGRPPVTIDADKWPLLASASDKEWDNEYEFQANRTSRWFLNVRTNDIGSALVYAVYEFSSSYQHERSITHRCGVKLDPGSTHAQICDAIEKVGNEIRSLRHYAEDADRWEEIKRDCVADVPAEVLD